MTVKELKEKIKDIPDDFVVTCTMDGEFKQTSGSARVYEVIDGYSWKSWGPDEFRLLHSDETMF